MRAVLLAVSLVALVPSVSYSSAIVTVTSDRPTTVYIDGELVGQAPLQLSNLKAGQHSVKVENLESGELKVYNVVSPRSTTIKKQIEVNWTSNGAAAPQSTRTVLSNGVVVDQLGAPAAVPMAQGVTVVQQVPVATAYAYPTYAPAPSYAVRQRGYQNAQNVRNEITTGLLGAAVANEVLNKGNSKSGITGGLLGGALLNQVVR